MNHHTRSSQTGSRDNSNNYSKNYSNNYLNAERLICEVFRSSRKEEMYLYVDKRNGLVDVPEALLERFGKPISIMTLMLTPDKPLARANSIDVLTAIRDKGFYFQMPPAKDDYLLDLYRAPTEARY